MPYSGVERRTVREPEEALHLVPGTEWRIVPLGAGPFGITMRAVGLGDVALQVGRSSPFLGFRTAGPETAYLQVPLEDADGLVLNGVVVDARSFGAYGPGAEVLRAGPRACGHSTLILAAGAVEALLEPPAGSGLFRPGSAAVRRSAPPAAALAARLIVAAGSAAAAAPATFDADQPRLALRDALIRAARRLVASSRAEEAPARAPRSWRARRRIVLAADGYLRAHLDLPIYTDELCGALGISASALADAFRAVFVVSPHRFLKLRRLHMVRTTLRRRGGPAPLVKAVALSHGFWHLGQFAHDYRVAFGEAPSETLARARDGETPARQDAR